MLKKIFLNHKMELLVILFCTFQARDLLRAWRRAPVEQYVWVVFVLWLLTVFIVIKKSHELEVSHFFMVGALAFSFAHTLASLNFFGHVALAISVSSLVPRKYFFPCVISAFLWMPACGWLFTKYMSIPLSLISRLLGQILTCLLLLRLGGKTHE